MSSELLTPKGLAMLKDYRHNGLYDPHGPVVSVEVTPFSDRVSSTMEFGG